MLLISCDVILNRYHFLKHLSKLSIRFDYTSRYWKYLTLFSRSVVKKYNFRVSVRKTFIALTQFSTTCSFSHNYSINKKLSSTKAFHRQQNGNSDEKSRDYKENRN